VGFSVTLNLEILVLSTTLSKYKGYSKQIYKFISCFLDIGSSFLTSREAHNLRAFKNRAMETVAYMEREETGQQEAEENCVICTLHLILLGYSNRGG
jgi:hypothetical protein